MTHIVNCDFSKCIIAHSLLINLRQKQSASNLCQFACSYQHHQLLVSNVQTRGFKLSFAQSRFAVGIIAHCRISSYIGERYKLGSIALSSIWILVQHEIEIKLVDALVRLWAGKFTHLFFSF